MQQPYLLRQNGYILNSGITIYVTRNISIEFDVISFHRNQHVARIVCSYYTLPYQTRCYTKDGCLFLLFFSSSYFVYSSVLHTEYMKSHQLISTYNSSTYTNSYQVCTIYWQILYGKMVKWVR